MAQQHVAINSRVCEFAAALAMGCGMDGTLSTGSVVALARARLPFRIWLRSIAYDDEDVQCASQTLPPLVMTDFMFTYSASRGVGANGGESVVYQLHTTIVIDGQHAVSSLEELLRWLYRNVKGLNVRAYTDWEMSVSQGRTSYMAMFVYRSEVADGGAEYCLLSELLGQHPSQKIPFWAARLPTVDMDTVTAAVERFLAGVAHNVALLNSAEENLVDTMFEASLTLVYEVVTKCFYNQGRLPCFRNAVELDAYRQRSDLREGSEDSGLWVPYEGWEQSMFLEFADLEVFDCSKWQAIQLFTYGQPLSASVFIEIPTVHTILAVCAWAMRYCDEHEISQDSLLEDARRLASMRYPRFMGESRQREVMDLLLDRVVQFVTARDVGYQSRFDAMCFGEQSLLGDIELLHQLFPDPAQLPKTHEAFVAYVAQLQSILLQHASRTTCSERAVQNLAHKKIQVICLDTNTWSSSTDCVMVCEVSNRTGLVQFANRPPMKTKLTFRMSAR